MIDGPPHICSVTLLARQPFQLDSSALLDQLQAYCGRVEPVMAKDDDGTFAYAFLDYRAQYADGSIPPQAFLSIGLLEEFPDVYQVAVGQSWGWAEARSVVAQCQHSLTITDLMAGGLEPVARLTLFHEVIASVLELAACDALYWMNSQQFIDPAAYRENLTIEPFNPLYGALNVRLFNVQDAQPDEMLMDSMGLAVFGLPDVQCHFVNLEPNGIARVLYNVAAYLFEKGDVIQDGETVPGIAPDSKWRCQHEAALVGPARAVLDINPGHPYAAGGRR